MIRWGTAFAMVPHANGQSRVLKAPPTPALRGATTLPRQRVERPFAAQRGHNHRVGRC